tara:strand:+ start:1285 stop:1638 length:354 start_codon:yes stop_codon:yes gene_type:complete
MPSSSGAVKRSRRRAVRAALATEVQKSDAEAPLLSLPMHIINLNLSPENLRDSLVLARLCAVNCEMRDAVAATGRVIREHTEAEATGLGYLSMLKHLHSRGRLRRKESLCAAAASSG